MTTSTRQNLEFIIVLLSVLTAVEGLSLFWVGILLLRREDEPARSKPLAARRNPHVDMAVRHKPRAQQWCETCGPGYRYGSEGCRHVPRDPDPVIRIPVVDVTYRPADDATVVVQPAQTRFDLLKQHTERSIRARGSNG